MKTRGLGERDRVTSCASPNCFFKRTPPPQAPCTHPSTGNNAFRTNLRVCPALQPTPTPLWTSPCPWPLLRAPILCFNQLIWLLRTKDLAHVCPQASPQSADSWIPNPEGPTPLPVRGQDSKLTLSIRQRCLCASS